jgi:nucleoside-diphosphate-sugar epimerase
MKALVTGASGFIGSTLIEELNTLGFEVHALLRKSSLNQNLEGLEYKRIDGDLSDFESLSSAVREVDYVFHLAGTTQARTRSEFFQVNAHGTERLVRAVSRYRSNLTRFVFVSSLAAAGPAQTLQSRVESDLDCPVSNYGESKLQAEKEVLKYQFDFPISIVRPPMVYGPKDRGVFFLIQTIARNFMPILQGDTQDGHKYYSAIHVKDLCRGIVQAAVASPGKVPSGEKFYLTGDGIYTYQEFMSTIAERLNCDPMRIKIPSFAVKTAAAGLSAFSLVTRKSYPLNLDKLHEVLSDYWICSSQKAKTMLGFSPEFDLVSGMSHAIEWYKRQRWI